MTKLVHCNKAPYDVYIGRPSKWGNPFKVGIHGTRDEIIKLYAQWIHTETNLIGDLHELKGKTLACWCSPQPCHGDVLIKMVNEYVK